MVLEATARDGNGRILFEETETWFEIGLNADRDMRYGAWQIKETVDLALQPLEVHRQRYLMHFDTDTREVEVEVTLRYFLGADQGRIVDSFRRKLHFDQD